MRIKPNATYIKDYATETSADKAALRLEKKAGCVLHWVIGISGKNSDRFTPIFIMDRNSSLQATFIPQNGYLVVG